jgi:hypothetical protein
MSIILDGTSGITTPGVTGITTPVSVGQGGTGRASTTAYAVICGGTTSTAAEQSIASVGTSGQLLTSNGASALPTFQTPSSGSLTLLGTLTTTSSNSLSLGSLDLTSYKYLYVVSSGVSSNTASSHAYLSASNSQVYGDTLVFNATTSFLNYGVLIFDLTSGANLQQSYTNVANSSTYDANRTDITTSSTTIYLRQSGTATFDAGSFLVYGGK